MYFRLKHEGGMLIFLFDNVKSILHGFSSMITFLFSQ